MKAAVLALGLTALVGCGTNPIAPNVGEEFELSIGQSATVNGRGIRIALQDVPEDSRCPSDVVCIQAGNATLAITVTSPGRKLDLEINTSGPSSVVIADDLELTLQGLEPYPRTTDRTTKEDYRARLVVLERMP